MSKAFGENEYWKLIDGSIEMDSKQFKCKTAYDEAEDDSEELISLSGYKNIDFKGAYLNGKVTFYNLTTIQAEALLSLKNKVVSWFPYEDNEDYSFLAKIILLPPINNALTILFKGVNYPDVATL